MALLGGLVYLRNPKSAMSRYFLIFCLSTTAWTIAHYWVDHAASLENSLVFARIASVAAFNVVFWLVLFSIKFGKSPRWATWPILGGLWLAGTIYSYSDLVYNSAAQGEGIINIGHGEGYLPYIGMIIVLLILALWHLISAKRHASALQRTQIDFILFGITVTFGVAIVNNGLIPLFVDNWTALKYTSILAVFFVSSVSYAIIKHRLFDIRFVIARTVAYTILLAVLMTGYTLAVFALSGIFFRGDIEEGQAIAYAGLAVFVAITFQPLKQWLIKVTDHIFYKSQYDSDALLSQLTHLMASTLHLRTLTSASLEAMVKNMHITRGAFAIAEHERFKIVAAIGYDQEEKLDTSLLRHLSTFGRLLVYDEERDQDVQKEMHQIKAAVILPLFANRELQGVVILGEKLSGDLYQDKDMKLLEIVGPELAVALDNSRSYQQISEFNQTLEHEVEKATTDLKKANQKLMRSNEKLRQLDMLKDEFISVTSHELRTPLTAIRSYIWMAMHGKRKDKNYDEYMSRAYISTERLITMVNDTLDVSRIESGRMTLSVEPTDINQLTQEVIDSLSAKAAQKSQTLKLKKSRLLPLADCDPAKIYQVLTNLIGNAIKFTPEKGKITIDFKPEGKHIVVRVKDDGPGITQEDQQKLFQKFSRLESAASIPGTGLGLYLCQQIIKLSGGKIWIESKAGQGTAFLFTLDASDTKKPPATKRPQQFYKTSSI